MDYIKLIELTEVITKGTTPTSVGFNFEEEGDVNFVKVESFDSDGNIKLNKIAKISSDCNNALSRSQLKENDILFSIAGALGRVAIVSEDILPANTNQALAIIRLLEKNPITINFLKYYFQSDSILQQVNGFKGGVAQQNLSLSQIKEFNIPNIHLEEQQAIVAKLDQAFAAINQAKANIEKNIANAKELFQSKLNQIFSQRGEGWVERTLGDICDLYQGLAINAKTKHLIIDKSDYPLLRIKDLKKYSEELYVDGKNISEKAHVDINDIIYTRTGSLGLVYRGRKGVLHNNSFKIIIKENIKMDNNFLFIWLQNPIFNKKILSLASKAAQPDITHKLFKEQLINFPTSIHTQQQIVTQLDQLQEQTNLLVTKYQQKLANLEELKKSILEKAFKGEFV